MFNLKKQEKEPDYPEVITQIHEEFKSAGDKLYQEALAIINSTKILNEKKAMRLKKLGFTATKEVIEAENIIQERKISKETVKLIQYYKNEYPLNKFISQKHVIEICGKYGLIYGDIEKYIGFVPEKNLKDIESFSIKNKDLIYRDGSMSTYGSDAGRIIWDAGDASIRFASIYKKVTAPKGFTIAAPQKDFELSARERIIDYQIKTIPDPVVLAPVIGGYLIVTAWGCEASDPLVQNEINN